MVEVDAVAPAEATIIKTRITAKPITMTLRLTIFTLLLKSFNPNAHALALSHEKSTEMRGILKDSRTLKTLSEQTTYIILYYLKKSELIYVLKVYATISILFITISLTI